MNVVSDTGPLIYLSRIGQLSLLKKRFGTINIPEEVYREICIQGKGRPGSQKVKKADWIHTEKVQDNFLVDVLRLELDRGEAEVIALSKQIDAERVIIDEKIPREKLKSLNFKVVGTVGILVWASQENLIPDLKNLLDELREKGMWFSDKLYNKALEME
ncbi:MAG: DUF3368 domain-containing protein [Thermoplasmata archaeon]